MSQTSAWSLRWDHTPSIAFRHLSPNSVRFGYATEGALVYLRAAVHRRGQRSPKGVGINKTVEGSNIASKHPRKHATHASRVKKKNIPLDSNDFGFICAGVSNVVSNKRNV